MNTPSEKRFLKGNCQEPGCTKRVRHLRGYADVRVAWIDYEIKAFCGEHARKWDERYEAIRRDLPADDPRHLIPTSQVSSYQQKAAALAAEQEAVERAERAGRRASRPLSDSIRAANARAPRLVRLA